MLEPFGSDLRVHRAIDRFLRCEGRRNDEQDDGYCHSHRDLGRVRRWSWTACGLILPPFDRPRYHERMSSYERLLAYRRTLPRTPRLDRQTVRARGISFAVFSTPPVASPPPLMAINGGMLFDHG